MTPNYVCPHLVVVPRLCSSASDHDARLVRDQHAMVRKVGVGGGEAQKRWGQREWRGERGKGTVHGDRGLAWIWVGGEIGERFKP